MRGLCLVERLASQARLPRPVQAVVGGLLKAQVLSYVLGQGVVDLGVAGNWLLLAVLELM